MKFTKESWNEWINNSTREEKAEMLSGLENDVYGEYGIVSQKERSGDHNPARERALGIKMAQMSDLESRMSLRPKDKPLKPYNSYQNRNYKVKTIDEIYVEMAKKRLSNELHEEIMTAAVMEKRKIHF